MTKNTQPLDLKVEKTLSADEAMPAPHEGKTEQPHKPQPRNVRKLLLIGAAVIVVGLGAKVGWHYWTVGRFQESTDDAYVKADSTIVAPKVSGYVREVLVADNQPVRANQPLAKIDDRDYLVALEQAKADVAAAQADIENIVASLDQQQAAIAQAQSTVSVDQASLKFAQQDNDRYGALATQGAGSVQNAQQAVSKLDIAKATLQRDEGAVVSAQKQMGVLQAQLAKMNAALARDKAVQDQAELNLGYTTIVSPVDGVVGNRTLRVGQYVQSGTQLMAVVPVDNVYVVANFKETQLTDVKKGQPVDIAVDTFPGVALKGRVDSIAPASGQEFALLPPDNATGNFTKIVQRIPVKVVLDNDSKLAGLLRPGMSVTPTINLKDSDSAASCGETACFKAAN
ncbi:HlyD family secretion protein [Phyllobacterium myrsinacearum]|jgi:membrane fusion protein, multidrug efflux system|uniref:Hemolysin D n=1 Tax=Phyllobacterium myrsinacearum TaxID=28101 RepID=A0A2S9JHJ3_9HYPH|nr:HlyD family secretion protein [Phyllobacterium myrsinacearum]PRD52455.1 hemolysin D [Phyllobacterium myrsinacearum]PWV92172.1 membrane fusion protein (multidrug efflux system) [Phyllobacterium myrsinacearum]RZS77626.1 membrane fusion protein (multidrug efflux system) [Phyllobacterium myrsinacearum]RZV05019.1 membrane fusion protein (multidrug efflux system) [Phyllobacterium myrsinacearum]